MLRVFSTLTRTIEPFQPLEGKKVRMYVCGPTVYDFSHIGHGRAYVVYDAIVRYLRYRGYEVTYVRNITDIDDKIIRRAREENVSFDSVARTYTEAFNRDMADLGLVPPDVTPHATGTIDAILALIQTLVSRGKAYVAEGDVYFSIAAAENYGKLSKRNIEDLQAVARVDPGEKKKDPLDFALWKKAKEGEPSWPSPWGPGRPGWHIECSAMAKKHLGDTIDVHAGGQDLIFPHHENEIAQSEGANGVPFAKYWFHNGFLILHKEKMSKSLGNIVTLRSLLARFHPEALKLYLLSSHYRSPLDFSDEGVEEAARGLDRIYRVLLALPEKKGARAGEYVKGFEEAMDDDFNTARAVGALFDAVKEINRLQKKSETLEQAVTLRTTLADLGRVLGLLQDDPLKYFQRRPGGEAVDRVKVETLIAERAEARRAKDFARADRIRDELTAMKVLLEDSPEGTTWRLTS